MLTQRLLRLEYDPQGIFEDRPSQTVFHRNLPVPQYTVKDTGSRLEIDTVHFHMVYYYSKEERLTEHSLVIDAKNGFTNYGGRWHLTPNGFLISNTIISDLMLIQDQCEPLTNRR